MHIPLQAASHLQSCAASAHGLQLRRLAGVSMGIVGLLIAASSVAGPLSPADKRITDGVIQSDHRVFERAENRLKAINGNGRPLRDYRLAKAQCWLDAGFHEYTRNDRSEFPALALDQSAALATSMEQAGPGQLENPADLETPLINGAERLRPDLWATLDAMKKASGGGAFCAAHLVSCAEVQLVHAGHEFNQKGWRHAKPYVQIAEDLVESAKKSRGICE